MFARMLAAVFSLSALAFVFAEDYLSITQRGLDDVPPPVFYHKFAIPAGQRSGELVFPKQYKCGLEYDAYLPVVLKVEMRAKEGSALIEIKKDLSTVDIYRAGGDVSTKAEITVSLTCAHTHSVARRRRLSSSEEEARSLELVPSVGL